MLCHPNCRHVPNFPKKLLALSYGSDTRRPHWLTHLINLWMEIFFILRIKDLTTTPLILCTSSGNGAPPSMHLKHPSCSSLRAASSGSGPPVRLESHPSFSPSSHPFSQIHITQRFSLALPLFSPRLSSSASLTHSPPLPPLPGRQAREPVGAHLGHPRRWSGHRWLCHPQRGAPGTWERSRWSPRRSPRRPWRKDQEMPDSSRSGAQQAVKTWPTRPSLGTAAPPALSGAAHAPPERQWEVAGGGTLARAGPVGPKTPASSPMGKEDRLEPLSLWDAALQALKGGVECVAPSQKRDGGIIAQYGAHKWMAALLWGCFRKWAWSWRAHHVGA